MRPDAPRHTVLDEEAQRRRIMIVGDIHGCADEFRDLLAAHHLEQDVLILAGDLVNKGPKSVEVVRLARELQAHAVVGNHELAALRGQHERDGGNNSTAALKYAWTDGLDERDLEFIRSLPYTISLPLHNAIVVHAGLVPEIPLEQQNLSHMVSMRNLRHPPYEALEMDAPGTQAWASVWKGPQFVYFGHDAKRRLQLEEHAMGLDTGVLYGGQLTAAIVELGKPTRVVSVPAREAYVQPGSSGKTKACMECSIVTKITIAVLLVGLVLRLSFASRKRQA